jgi:hypothetical protein
VRPAQQQKHVGASANVVPQRPRGGNEAKDGESFCACMCVCMCMYMYVCVLCVCVCVYIYIYICAHTMGAINVAPQRPRGGNEAKDGKSFNMCI